MYRIEKWPEAAWLLLFAGSALMVLGGLLLLYLEFRSEGELETVSVSGLSTLTEDDILEGKDLQPGLYIDEETISRIESGIEANPYIAEAEAEFDGGHLQISIQEQKCFFVLRTRKGLIDIGMQLNPISQTSRCVNVPVLSGDLPGPDGLNERPALVRFFGQWQNALTEHPGMTDRISEIHFDRTGGITVYMVHRQLRALLPELPGPLTFDKLSAAVYFVEEENKKATVIDLRGPDALILTEN